MARALDLDVGRAFALVTSLVCIDVSYNQPVSYVCNDKILPRGRECVDIPGCRKEKG